MNMNSRISSAAVALALMMTGSGAHAFGNNCRDVDLLVTNNFGQLITVTKFELWSQSEGRWLDNDIANVDVPVGAQNRLVRDNENVEYAENDKITKILVHWEHEVANLPHHHHHEYEVVDSICVAGTRYHVTIE